MDNAVEMLAAYAVGKAVF